MSNVTTPSYDTTPTVPHTNAEPHWELSDLDAALAQGRSSVKPVFAYWSTGWCPPCAEMRVTVFRKSEFLSRCSDLVMLGIDGDAPLAQTAGDRLGTTVYPTMQLLGGDGTELLRFPGGLTAVQFCEALDLARTARTAVSALAARVLEGKSLGDDEFRLLAYHYWAQDGRAYIGDKRPALLEVLDASVPQRLESEVARIFLWRLIETASRNATNPSTIQKSVREHLRERLLGLLHSPQCRYSILYYLIVGMPPVLDLLAPQDDGDRQHLLESLLAALGRVLEEAGLSATERLITLSTHADVARRLAASGELDAATRERAHVTVAQLDAQTTWPVERQSVMNMAGHLLKQCGFRGEAETLFARAAKDAIGPTYFMPYLAELCIEEGRSDEALVWWRRAYEETQGKNSRFALGARYVAALIRYFPDKAAGIEALVARMLGELGDDPDLTRSRNGNTLRQLGHALKSWRR